MVDRTQRILLELMKANGNPLTSAQLAQVVGVSSRTIKSTMPRVVDTLQANGAELSSRRNRGYSIVVHDDVAYHNLVEKTNMQAVHIAMAGYDDTTRILHICRKLVAAPAGAKIDEICEYTSIRFSSMILIANTLDGSDATTRNGKILDTLF